MPNEIDEFIFAEWLKELPEIEKKLVGLLMSGEFNSDHSGKLKKATIARAMKISTKDAIALIEIVQEKITKWRKNAL